MDILLQKVYGVYDDDNDIFFIFVIWLLDDDLEEVVVSIVSFGGYFNDNEMIDEENKDDIEDVNYSVVKSVDVIFVILGNVDVIYEYVDIDVFFFLFESIEWSDMILFELFINSDRIILIVNFVIILDIDRVQFLFYEQIFLLVV